MQQRAERLNTHCKLGLYTLAAGAMVAGNATAAPTLSPNSPATFAVPTDGSDSFEFDIDGNAVPDFVFFVFSSEFCSANSGRVDISAYAGSNSIFATADNVYGGDYAAMVAPGQSVPPGDAGITAESSATLTSCYFPDVDAFPVGETGFFGVQFDRSGNNHYGYIEYRAENGSMIANVLEACFESDPDTPIAVGACSRDEPEPVVPAVPVPVAGVAVPLSLAMLALGGLALRRRKQQA